MARFTLLIAALPFALQAAALNWKSGIQASSATATVPATAPAPYTTFCGGATYTVTAPAGGDPTGITTVFPSSGPVAAPTGGSDTLVPSASVSSRAVTEPGATASSSPSPVLSLDRRNSGPAASSNLASGPAASSNLASGPVAGSNLASGPVASSNLASGPGTVPAGSNGTSYLEAQPTLAYPSGGYECPFPTSTVIASPAQTPEATTGDSLNDDQALKINSLGSGAVGTQVWGGASLVLAGTFAVLNGLL
ncbi:hypothetical protein FA15DRAFT_757616 [Coprinopsis marcescibilis]|uniref:Uncharacterized protein n=1 Tax=Coprinopsis marcescibilis TaxID=230819 RepID=A0A5C3KT07_COPMA|nr:hypothetical protein FA15DRAFT_757616 [Coprinopsis marcescibilis]